ncbi:LysR family transcriptional regulator [Galactobacter valiniphilus]|uniref:LysR family transcriptional regulator n=1 Tax=Galactobacter valiniphilus TaxID=2676122 RepID=UPI003736F198
MSLRITLRQLECFAALAQHATLRAAASELHVSESALSHTITQLEAEVGEQLCVRRKAKGVILTPAGRTFLERSRAILRAADALGSDRDDDDALRGRVELGCYTGLASNLLPSIMEEVHRTHPGVEIGLTVGDSDELLAASLEGKIDLALVYDIGLPDGFHHTRLYDTEVVAVLAAEDSLAQQERVSLEQLAEKQLLVLATAPSTSYTELMFAQAGVEPRVGPRLPHIDLVRALVARGIGYSLLMSRPHQAPYSTEGFPIVTRPLEPRAGLTSVVALWPEGVRLTKRAAALLECAQDALAGAEIR